MRLKRREKFLLTGLIFLLAVLAVVVLVVLPARQRVQFLDRLVVKKEKELARVLALREEWIKVSQTRDRALGRIKKRGKGFAIFSYLENLARNSGLKSKIQYMRPLNLPEESSAEGLVKRALEIRLKEVTIDQLVNYLYHIEYSDKMLKVESLRLKAVYTDPRFINATLRVVTYDLG